MDMGKMEKTLMEKLPRYMWLFLMFVTGMGVIFAGAYWHLFTMLICGIMYLTLTIEEKDAAQAAEEETLRKAEDVLKELKKSDADKNDADQNDNEQRKSTKSDSRS